MVSEATSVRADVAAPVQAVQRTMRVLECLVEAGSAMSVLELASAVAVDKSVVSRLLAN
jgi:DNA-binding IclR family transcriptional regulator